MASRKCPNCRRREFSDSALCSHCGERLIVIKSSNQSSKQTQTAKPAPLPRSKKSHESSTSQPDTNSTPPPSPPPKPFSPSTTTSPVPYTPPPSPSPYPSPHKSTPVPYSPPHSHPTHSPRFIPLPPKMARLSAPQVEGEVIFEKIIQIEKKDKTGWLRIFVSILLLPFKPAMILLAWVFGGNRPKDKQDVIIIRVEEPSGNIAETRYQEELKGTSITVGDYVSLWGIRKIGVLYVKEGFNHTSGGQL
jgi:hypothetical protein